MNKRESDLKGKISGTVLILLLMLTIGAILLSVGLFSWFVLNYPYGVTFFAAGVLLIIFVLNIVASALVKPGPWQKTRKNLLIAVALLIMLVAGLVLIPYGVYYMEVEVQKGFALLGFGIAALNIFSLFFFYVMWKNWYEWESKILKILTPLCLVAIIIIAILITLSILKVM